MIPAHLEQSSEAIEPEQFQRLLEISARLSSTLDLPRLLTQVVNVVVELTDTIDASILLLDQKTDELRFVAATNDSTLQNIIVPKDSIAGWIVKNGKPFVSNDVQSNTYFFAGVDNTLQRETRNLLGVPLKTQKHIIGALEVLNKRDNQPYTAQDVALLQALAGQAAVAIENARLFQQSDLIAEIMHELKTPLMAITSASELALRPELPAETQTELLQMIQQESLRMSNMTKDFLYLARLESGRLHMAEETVHLAQVVNEVIRLTNAQAGERGINISTHLPVNIPAIIGDKNRLQQVLINLVSNAIKYNIDNGKIEILVNIEPNKILLKVKDTGIGLSSVDLEHLFVRFYRVGYYANNVEGSGLGLSIAQKIMEEHGGHIEVTSKLGHGSVFCCVFPLNGQ
jgi:signal transduction histidine kinase